jgi:hypothetical protein
MDDGKMVKGCDGYFEPSGLTRQGPMRQGKTAQDSMPVDLRPRVIAAKKRAGR